MAMLCPQHGPEPGLGGFDEGEHLRREERPLPVLLRVAAGRPAAALQQDFLNVGLKGVFGGLAHGIDQPLSNHEATLIGRKQLSDQPRSDQITE